MAVSDLTVLQQLNGHTSDVTYCDFAPNFTLITGSSDKTIRIWDWSAGFGYSERTICSPIRAHKYGITCVQVSPQGAMFAVASVDGTATLWGLRSNVPNKLGTLVQVNGDAMRVLRFAPDSSILLTGGDNGAICIWDLIHRTLIRTIFKHEGTVHGIAFTPDSELAISACSTGVIYIWQVAILADTTNDQTPQPITSVDNAHDLGVLSCDIAPYIQTNENNPLIKLYTLATSGNDDNIRVWQIIYHIAPKHLGEFGSVDVEIINELVGHESAVTSLKYSSNSALLASTSLDKTVKLWTSTGECLKSEKIHSRYVNCVVFSRDITLLATGSNDKSIIVWDLTSTLTLDSELLKPHMQLGHIFAAPAANNSIQENQVVQNAESDDNEVELIEIVDDIHDGVINVCQFYKNSCLATGSGDKLIKVFNILEESLTLEESLFSPFEGHKYPVNHLDFSSDGTKLVSCSQDGTTIIWSTQTGEQLANLPESDLSIRVCKFSPDGTLLVTAGDTEKAYIWNTETFELILELEGHAESIISTGFTPDSKIIVTVCNNGDFRLWTTNGLCVHVEDDAHDLGVQCCDFSPNFEPIPNMSNIDNINYLLATCGNDSLVKLWRITIPKIENTTRHDHINVKLWRTLMGHGGNVMSVKFSPTTGEIVCSTATDKQARLWSVYSSECLHVLEHDSMTITASFLQNMYMLAVGCLDKTLWLWKLPQKLIFQTIVANRIRIRRKSLIDWRTEDIAKWLRELDMCSLSEKVMETTLDGRNILIMSEEDICNILEIEAEEADELIVQLKWLKQDELNPRITENLSDIPEEFLCPITRELMRTPVQCSDGFTYEKQAITEWFLSGKFTSPMTNELLPNTDYVLNKQLRDNIRKYLYKMD